MMFDRECSRCLQEELQAKRREADALAKKVRQQAIAIDFLKNLRNEVNLPRRVELLHEVRCDDNKPLTISLAADLLSVNRTSVYAKAVSVSYVEIAENRLINVLHTDHPAWQRCTFLGRRLMVRWNASFTSISMKRAIS